MDKKEQAKTLWCYAADYVAALNDTDKDDLAKLNMLIGYVEELKRQVDEKCY